MTNKDIARKFAAGKAARVKHYHSTGRECYSYRMKLAQYLPDGSVEIIKSIHSPSQTTSRHLSILRGAFGYSGFVEVDSFTSVSPFSYGETG
jgi:hypothetical protein